jgi:hypothetical protein
MASLDRIVTATKLFGQVGQRFDNYSTLPLELALVDSVMMAEGKPSPVPTVEAKAPPPAAAAAPAQDFKRTAPQPKTASPAADPPRTKPAPAPPASYQAKPAAGPPIHTRPSESPSETLPATPLEANTEIERLRLNWKLIIKQAPPDTQKTAALGILRSAPVKPVSLENNVVCLACRNNIFKEMIEKTENRRVIERVISSFLGHPCQIQCILEENHLVKEALKMGAQITNVEEQ